MCDLFQDLTNLENLAYLNLEIGLR